MSIQSLQSGNTPIVYQTVLPKKSKAPTILGVAGASTGTVIGVGANKVLSNIPLLSKIAGFKKTSSKAIMLGIPIALLTAGGILAGKSIASLTFESRMRDAVEDQQKKLNVQA